MASGRTPIMRSRKTVPENHTYEQHAGGVRRGTILSGGAMSKIDATCIFMCCTFMDSDVYSADAPGSIPTLLTINALAL